MYQWEWEEDIHHNVVFKINFSIEKPTVYFAPFTFFLGICI